MNIVFDLGSMENGELHVRRRVIGDSAAVVHQADAGDHGVLASGQQAQHGARLLLVIRFSENPIVHHHDGVGAQHDLIRLRRGGSGLFEGQPAGVVDRGLTRLSNFRNRPRTDRKLETRKREQFAAARGLGSKNELRHCVRYTILSC